MHHDPNFPFQSKPMSFEEFLAGKTPPSPWDPITANLRSRLDEFADELSMVRKRFAIRAHRNVRNLHRNDLRKYLKIMEPHLKRIASGAYGHSDDSLFRVFVSPPEYLINYAPHG